MSGKKKKPGFFAKLFGSSSTSKYDDDQSSKSLDKGAQKQNNKQRESNISSSKPSTSNSGAPKSSTSRSVPTASGSSGAAACGEPRKASQSVAVGQQRARGAADRQRSRGGSASGGGKKNRRRKGAKKKTCIESVDVSQPLDFPTTPEQILARHKAQPMLNKNEEWLLVELNEFECLVESIDIIKTIAKHSQFFEVEPDELWEQFFEFVEEMPSYDDIINFDVWQEFRDAKYPC